MLWFLVAPGLWAAFWLYFAICFGEWERLVVYKRKQTTTRTSVLMALSRQVGVSNFCSNSLSSFLLIGRILFSQFVSFQILFYALFPRFPWSTLLPFPSYFNFHNFTYLGIDVSMRDMTIPPQTALNYHILNLHNNTYPITKNISWHPINQSHPTHHPDHTTLHPHATSPHLQQ